MKGRKPKSAEVAEAQGNPGRRRILKAPEVGTGSVAPPKELTAAAKRIWQDLAPSLTSLKFLRETDRPAFTRYCLHLSDWFRLTIDLRKEGETYESVSAHNPDGMLRVNPKFLIRERVEKRLEVLEDRFGLSPASRQQIMQRLAIAVPPTQPPLFDQSGADAATVAPVPTDQAIASPIGLLSGNGRIH